VLLFTSFFLNPLLLLALSALPPPCVCPPVFTTFLSAFFFRCFQSWFVFYCSHIVFFPGFSVTRSLLFFNPFCFSFLRSTIRTHFLEFFLIRHAPKTPFRPPFWSFFSLSFDFFIFDQFCEGAPTYTSHTPTSILPAFYPLSCSVFFPVGTGGPFSVVLAYEYIGTPVGEFLLVSGSPPCFFHLPLREEDAPTQHCFL